MTRRAGPAPRPRAAGTLDGALPDRAPVVAVSVQVGELATISPWTASTASSSGLSPKRTRRREHHLSCRSRSRRQDVVVRTTEPPDDRVRSSRPAQVVSE